MLYAFDGTWNHDGVVEQRTNVCRLAQAMDPNEVVYLRGIGNALDCAGFARFAGGAFGLGFGRMIDAAIARFRACHANGDTVVDVIGFSRGAAAALVFLNKLRQWQAGDRRHRPLRLRFCGLFDAVDALGVPDVDWEFWYDKRLAPGVERAVHAIALHETRATFAALDVRGAEQRGFSGNHCDIGGGYRETGLSDITLAWMYRHARAAGIRFAVPRSRLGLQPDPTMPPHRVLSFNYMHQPRTLPQGLITPKRYRWPIMVSEPDRRRQRKVPGAAMQVRWRFIDEAYTIAG